MGLGVCKCVCICAMLLCTRVCLRSLSLLPTPSLYVCLCAHRVINYKVILFHTHAAKYNPYHDDKMMDYLQGYTVSHACAQLD